MAGSPPLLPASSSQRTAFVGRSLGERVKRKSPRRVTLNSIDRLLLVWLYRLAPGVLDALKIIRPETVLRWHRQGSEPIGAGNRDRAAVGRRCQRTFAA
jgi:hypothetical protein